MKYFYYESYQLYLVMLSLCFQIVIIGKFFFAKSSPWVYFIYKLRLFSLFYYMRAFKCCFERTCIKLSWAISKTRFISVYRIIFLHKFWTLRRFKLLFAPLWWLIELFYCLSSSQKTWISTVICLLTWNATTMALRQCFRPLKMQLPF